MVGILDSILDSLGVDGNDKNFVTEIELFLSSIFSILNQLGATNKPYRSDITWSDIKDENIKDYEFDIVKTYILMKTRLFFDPPTGTTLSYWERQCEVLEWRIREFFGITKEGGTN